MDELIRQGQWWWLLLPLGTGIFALAGSWLGSFLGRNTEHKQWVRDSKQKAYADYLTSIVESATSMDSQAEAQDAQRKSTIALSQLRLIGNPKVTEAAVSFSDHVNGVHMMSRARTEMIKLDLSANESDIIKLGEQISLATREIPRLTAAYVQAARVDVGTKTH